MIIMVKAIQLEYLEILCFMLSNKEQSEGFHVGLSVGCCSSGLHMRHVYDVEAKVLKAVRNIFRRRLSEGDGLPT
jgi:hypothetical protein